MAYFIHRCVMKDSSSASSAHLLAGPILVFVLFYVLTPGVVLTLPPHASKEVVAATHALVFTALLNVIHYLLYKEACHVGCSVVAFVLFYALTPGILLRLPPHGNKYEVAAVHGLVFTVIHCLLASFLFRRQKK